MPTVVVETGAGLANANSYVSLAYADTYFAGHPFYADAWELLDQSTREAYIIYATLQLDNEFIWRGRRATGTQALDWPRTGVYDLYDLAIAENSLPLRLMQATCEQAYYLTKGDRSAETQTSGEIDKLKIDVIELDFSSSSSTSFSTQPVGSTVRGLLRGLGDYASGMRVRRVVVG